MSGIDPSLENPKKRMISGYAIAVLSVSAVLLISRWPFYIWNPLLYRCFFVL